MKVGIIGKPAAGKTTLFRLLTGKGDSGRQEASIGMARVPDERIDRLSAMFKPKKTTYAQVEVLDLAGAASDGQDRKALIRLTNHMRTMDALINVVRCFGGETGPVQPYQDASHATDELILADMATAEVRVERLSCQKKRTADEEAELELMSRLGRELGEGKSLRQVELSAEDRERLIGYGLLSLKPMVMCLNLGEEELLSKSWPDMARVREHCASYGIPLVELCAGVEAELAEMDEADRAQLMEEYGIEESGVGKMAKAVYKSLGLISFFTAGEDEVRAWPIPDGISAKGAAGKIHTDIEKGFIRAETVGYEDFMGKGGMAGARNAGLFRLEGRDYVVKDGDIMNFRFSQGK
ncbi:MAG: YchF family ATPase [Firmicutes bacterium]|nr:YchF family ATPase [Bacillota bacterium]